MYKHLHHFLEKIAVAGVPDFPQSGGPAVVPSFPPASGTNMGVATAPPLPAANTFDPPVKGGTPKSIGGSTSGTSSTSAASSMSKGSAVRTVDDFTAKVRGPIADARREQYTSPFDEKSVEWGAATSVEGGDAGTRWAPSGTTHPDVKIAVVTKALTMMGRRLSAPLGRRAAQTVGKGLTGDIVSSAGFAPSTFALPTAKSVSRRGFSAGRTRLTGFGSPRSRSSRFSIFS